MANPFDQFDQGPPAPVAAAPAAPAPAAAPAKNPFDQFDAAPAAAAAPAPAAPPEAPNETVNRLQSKIDDGTASQAERDQWLDARTADLHQASLPGRIARTIANAPYSKILPEIGGWLKNTASDAIDTGKKIAPAVVAPTPENLATAGKTIGSAAIGATAEGGSIGKGLLGIIGNTGISLNPFSHDSDVGPRIQAQSELQLSDMLRNVDPKAVKDLAPDQKAANTGAAAVDVASALAGPEADAAKPAIAITQPERLMGVSASKAIKAAQVVAETSPSAATKAAASYMATALAKAAHPAVSAAIDAAKGTAALGMKAAKAVAPLATRTAAGAVIGGALGAVGASPGDTEEAAASGAAGGAMAGAARTPLATKALNGVAAPEPGVSLKLKTPLAEPPHILAEPVPPKPALALANAGGPEVQGPPAPPAAGGAGVDEANAVVPPARPPVKLGTTPPPTQPVSRLAGGPEAVGGLIDQAQQGNAQLRAEALTGDGKVTPELVKDQAQLADKPLATVGPVPDTHQADPSAMKASQDLGAAMLKQPGLDTFMNTLFGGNRGGTGTPTSAVRIHSLPDGATFEVAGQKVQVVRPEGVEGVTVLRTNNPQIPDIAIHQPTGATSEGHTVPTDKGRVEVARVDPENPDPMMIGGEPHQVISSKGMRDPLVLADSAGNKKILASRQILNADKGTAPELKSPVPMTDALGSSNLKSYGYDAATQTLYVQPKGGGLYMHEGVPIEVAKAMDAAESKGKFYNAEVKKKFPFQ